jgi:transcriptional regulator with XRE-family HTH domain
MTDTKGRSLGATIQYLRTTQGLSIRQLAALIGAAPSLVLRWERDDVVPKQKYLSLLAQTLETSTADLFSLSGVPYPYDAPSLPAMLRAEYDLPPDAIAEIERSIKRIARKYGSESTT